MKEVDNIDNADNLRIKEQNEGRKMFDDEFGESDFLDKGGNILGYVMIPVFVVIGFLLGAWIF